MWAQSSIICKIGEMTEFCGQRFQVLFSEKLQQNCITILHNISIEINLNNT